MSVAYVKVVSGLVAVPVICGVGLAALTVVCSADLRCLAS